jgi:hypothetical protein
MCQNGAAGLLYVRMVLQDCYMSEWYCRTTICQNDTAGLLYVRMVLQDSHMSEWYCRTDRHSVVPGWDIRWNVG